LLTICRHVSEGLIHFLRKLILLLVLNETLLLTKVIIPVHSKQASNLFNEVITISIAYKNPCGAEGEEKARFPQGREDAIPFFFF
jgi:hypothetical protein